VTHKYKTYYAIIVIYATREFNKADFTHFEYCLCDGLSLSLLSSFQSLGKLKNGCFFCGKIMGRDIKIVSISQYDIRITSSVR
jgi:hypothetical protein